MYYTACLLLTVEWQLLCQAVVSLVYKWEGLLKIVWGGCNPSNPPPLDPPLGHDFRNDIHKFEASFLDVYGHNIAKHHVLIEH